MRGSCLSLSTAWRVYGLLQDNLIAGEFTGGPLPGSSLVDFSEDSISVSDADLHFKDENQTALRHDSFPCVSGQFDSGFQAFSQGGADTNAGRDSDVMDPSCWTHYDVCR